MTVDESPSAFKCRILNNMRGNRQSWSRNNREQGFNRDSQSNLVEPYSYYSRVAAVILFFFNAKFVSLSEI